VEVTDNKVRILDDGRVEITLLMPLPLFSYKKWIRFYTRGSELIIQGDKITGIRCHPKVWEEALKSLASNRPESVENFRKIVEEGTRKSKEKVKATL